MKHLPECGGREREIHAIAEYRAEMRRSRGGEERALGAERNWSAAEEGRSREGRKGGR